MDFAVAARLCTVKQFCKANAQFTEKQVRWWAFRSADNGMDDKGVVVRHPDHPRSMLIDVDAFEAWWTSTRPARPHRRQYFLKSSQSHQNGAVTQR